MGQQNSIWGTIRHVVDKQTQPCSSHILRLALQPTLGSHRTEKKMRELCGVPVIGILIQRMRVWFPSQRPYLLMLLH